MIDLTSTPPRSLVDMFEDSMSRHAPRTLFLTKRGARWREISYEQFQRTVDLVRGGLAQLGVGPGDRVGIIAGNSVEWAALAYASYGLGAAFVPMYETQLASDWAFIISDANLKVVAAANPSVVGKLAPLGASLPASLRWVALDEDTNGSAKTAKKKTAETMTFAHLLGLGERHPAPVRAPVPEDIACLMYTSGTTGEPKGVILTHANIVSNIVTLLGLIPVEDNHVTLSFLPWAHAFGHTAELHMVVAGGGAMAIAESVDKIVDNLVEVRPTVLVAVPRLFMRVYASVQKTLETKPRPIRWLAARGLAAARKRSQGTRLTRGEKVVLSLFDRLILAKVRRRLGGRLQYAVSGAAALPHEVAMFVDALGVSVYEGYGLTETSPVVSANVPGQRKFGSVGKPLPGVRVVIDRSATDDPEQGEIVVSGPNVMRGYHNRREETKGVLSEGGALRTGDIGYLDEDGYLFITGRIKEQYKLANGKYVSPAPLEERLKLSRFIADVMIYGDNRLYNVALIVPDDEAVRAWAVDAKQDAEKREALRRNPALLTKIAGEIAALSTGFRGYERVAAFTLLPEGFTEDNGMLTPSMKLKRRNVVERWRAEIERLYACEPTSLPGAWFPIAAPERPSDLERLE
jgi:long-chain acyl-CoA synthetase